MKTSENIDQLVTALAAAHLEIETIPMTGENPHFKNKFSTLADIYGATNKQLSKNGLAYIQAPCIQDGRVVIATRLSHKSGQWVQTELSLKPQQDSPQQIGSAITYGRRYALSAMLGIAGEEDDDGEIAQGRGPTKNKNDNNENNEKPDKDAQKKIFDKNDPAWIGSLKGRLAKEGIDATEFDLCVEELHGKDIIREFMPMVEKLKRKYLGES